MDASEGLGCGLNEMESRWKSDQEKRTDGKTLVAKQPTRVARGAEDTAQLYKMSCLPKIHS